MALLATMACQSAQVQAPPQSPSPPNVYGTPVKASQPSNAELASALTEATSAWLTSLTGTQKTKCVIGYSDIQRTDWHFIPRPWRKGLALSEMTAEQEKLAMELLRVSISDQGFEKLHKIMLEQGFLRLTENQNPPNCCGIYGTQCGNGSGCPSIFDERYYFFSVFGQPTMSGEWGLSIEGHHFSVNYTIEGGQVIASTPTAFGSAPAIMIADNYPPIKKGTRNLALEQDLAIELYEMLLPDQKKVALLTKDSPRDIINAGSLYPLAGSPVGLRAREMTHGQRKQLRSLLEVYAHNMPEAIARDWMASIDENGFDEIYFAFMGTTPMGENKQYVVQGPAVLINFSNSQPDSQGNPANHIHAIWRNPKGDFNIGNPFYPYSPRNVAPE
ncbi:MAG: DUF3500 domain-containing protein [Acidobacteriota bacterium]